MKTTVVPALCAVLLFGAASAALAQQAAPAPGMPMPMPMPMPAAPAAGASASPSTQAFKAADDKMMQGMSRTMTGDADKDFVAGMIPHHQGAIDMARVELAHGKDPALRRLAAAIIKAQEKEIAEMKAWQAKHARN